MKMLMNKKEARVYARKTVLNLSSLARQKREEEILNLIINNKQFIKADKIGIYYPLNHEINILKLMEDYPEKNFYFPKTKKYNMTFRKVEDIADLEDGVFDLKEPKIDSLIEEEIDVYLVPCVATVKNYRLGHGAGYYDKYFSQHKGYKIGIVYNELKDLNVVMNDYDIEMDLIL